MLILNLYYISSLITQLKKIAYKKPITNEYNILIVYTTVH